MQSRINPQSIAAAEYKPNGQYRMSASVQPGARAASKPAVSTNVRTTVQPSTDVQPSTRAVDEALELLKRLTGVAAKPLRAVVATSKPIVPKMPSVATPGVTTPSAPTDNIQPSIEFGVRSIAKSIDDVRASADKTAMEFMNSTSGPQSVAKDQKVAAELVEMRNQYNELARKHWDLESQYSELARKHTELRTERVERDDSIHQLRSDLDEITARYINSESEHEDNFTQLQAKYDATKTAGQIRSAELLKQVRELTENNERLSAVSQSSTREEYDEILSQLINAQENTESLEEELALANAKNATLERRYKEVIAYNDIRYSDIVTALENKIREIKFLKDTLTVAVKEHQKLEGKLTGVQDQYDMLKVGVADSKTREVKLISVQEQYDTLMKRYDSMKNQYDTLDEDHRTLQVKHSKLTDAARMYISMTSKSE